MEHRALIGPGRWWVRLLVGRTLTAVLVVLGASLFIWALVPLMDGDPARLTLLARGVSEPTPDQVAELRDAFGLDQPLPLQYLSWLGRALTGDLGYSWQSGLPVTGELVSRLAPTIRLALTALLLALCCALPVGLIAARWEGGWPDQASRLLAIGSASTPSFLVGLLLISYVVVPLGWKSVVLNGEWNQVWLPAACLCFGMFDAWSRVWRGGLVAGLHSGNAAVLTARGAQPRRILLRHAVPNASAPLIGIVAVSAGGLLGGAAIIETVFTWPGVGAYVVSSVLARDLPVVQAYTVMATLTYVLASLAADLVTVAIDPRLRERR
ncbi:MAG TPA: ABC transporter permease [Propioniciclava sp.]|jgi:ABC-type dipeptide/oligopeptide/nickel transport system permease component|uniref:ABC transporter permease n=1 Tax=Propioniciclava sp. TaxID=2038686 RepID=UPI002D17326C|nr:ABC transporter permease [Propioniciclava sp.]HRL48463.1 ABC transporter permease [Propioniciclava sp.]HRL78944.1 ABC transporter permease [Propioniciclava sp.]